jgi:hypothetical protein
MRKKSHESELILALQALENEPELSIRTAASTYIVDSSTLARRRDNIPDSRKPTDSEKSIIQYVLNLDSRSFPPRLCNVEDMTNKLLTDRDAPLVGKRWASNFFKRQPQLNTRCSRRYNYNSAKCEDPEVIRG